MRETSTAPSNVFAGFWRRFAAFVVDTVILYFGVTIAMVLLSAVASRTPDAVYAVSCVALVCLYFAGYHSSRLQATPGKRMLKIKVTDGAGRRIPFVTGVLRFFASWLSALPFMLGYFMTAFTARKRALHDMIARTLVVNEAATEEEVVAGGGVMPITVGLAAAIMVPIIGAVVLAVVAIDAFRNWETRARSHVVE